MTETTTTTPLPDAFDCYADTSEDAIWRNLLVLDAETGDVMRGVWRADRVEGWCDQYERDDEGRYYVEPGTAGVLASRRVHKAIRFIWADDYE